MNDEQMFETWFTSDKCDIHFRGLKRDYSKAYVAGISTERERAKGLVEALEEVLGYDGDFLSTSADVRLNTAKFTASEALKRYKERG